jgi:hypothetical protein
LKKKRCETAFLNSKEELEELTQLNKSQYIDLYYGDASHFSLVPNIPYAWQAKDEPILLPAIRGKSMSVFGLMNTLGDLVFDVLESTITSEKLIVFFDKFVENITKKNNCSFRQFFASY